MFALELIALTILISEEMVRIGVVSPMSVKVMRLDLEARAADVKSGVVPESPGFLLNLLRRNAEGIALLSRVVCKYGCKGCSFDTIVELHHELAEHAAMKMQEERQFSVRGNSMRN
jgi:hypothetical protein